MLQKILFEAHSQTIYVSGRDLRLKISLDAPQKKFDSPTQVFFVSERDLRLQIGCCRFEKYLRLRLRLFTPQKVI